MNEKMSLACVSSSTQTSIKRPKIKIPPKLTFKDATGTIVTINPIEFTRNSNVYYVYSDIPNGYTFRFPFVAETNILLVGGGGGGGSTNYSTSSYGGGGGAGEFVTGTFSFLDTVEYKVSIGKGGIQNANGSSSIITSSSDSTLVYIQALGGGRGAPKNNIGSPGNTGGSVGGRMSINSSITDPLPTQGTIPPASSTFFRYVNKATVGPLNLSLSSGGGGAGSEGGLIKDNSNNAIRQSGGKGRAWEFKPTEYMAGGGWGGGYNSVSVSLPVDAGGGGLPARTGTVGGNGTTAGAGGGGGADKTAGSGADGKFSFAVLKSLFTV